MGNLVNREYEVCERFRDALDGLPAGGNAQRGLEDWRAELPEAEAQHVDGCKNCRTALEEFAETRAALAGMSVVEPGPWFTARVMGAIAAKEREEESRDGVWVYVRRLAPRMVALSALLLILGGSWAMQERNRELANPNGNGGDMVFDSSSSPTWYDDGLGAVLEVRP